MKIKRIKIKSYRSCIETEFEPNAELSALIGPNGSGKTTILTAIKLLYSLVYIKSRRFQNEDPLTSASEIKVSYDCNGKNVTHEISFDIITNENNQDEVIGVNESWYVFDFTGSRKKFHFPTEMFFELMRGRKGLLEIQSKRENYFHNYLKEQGLNDSSLKAIEEVVNFIVSISYYSASQFTNPSSCPISFEVEGEKNYRRGVSITGHKKLLYDMYQEYREKTETFSEYMDIVGQDGIGLVDEIKFSEIETSTSRYNVMTGGRVVRRTKSNILVIPSFSIMGNDLSPSQLSEGTFKAISLIFYLITDKSSLLMIEEPEVCVHHGLLSSIVELIKIYSKNKQIIISTHSDSILDSLDLKNVFIVKRNKNDGTTVSKLTSKLGSQELAALKNYLRDEGSLGEYWRHGDLEHG